MNCDQVRELETAFALDALDAATREAVAAHVEHCDGHPRLAELRAAAIAISGAVPEGRPPAGLRDRVLASARSPRAPVVTPLPEHRRGALSPWRIWPVGAAAALVIAVAVAAIIVFTGGDTLHTRQFSTEDGIAVRLEAELEQPNTVVSFSGLAQPPTGEEYVLWAIREGEWLRIGTFHPGAEGVWAGEFDFALREGDALCLTMTGTETAADPFGKPLFIEPV